MRLYGLLYLCTHFFLGDLSVVHDGSLPHNVQRRAPKKSVIGTTFSVSGGKDFSVGDTVVISCTVHYDKDKKADKEKLQLVWTKPKDKSKKVLVTETASSGISYTLGPVTAEHRGMYSCQGDNNTDVIITDWHELIWIKDPSPPVIIDLISINRVKYFYDKTATVGCQVPNDNSQWKIMRCDEVEGVVEECPNQIKHDNAVSCTVSSNYPMEMPYWCQSAAGLMSNVLNVSHAVREHRINADFLVTSYELTPAWFLRAGDNAAFDCHVDKDKKKYRTKLDLQLIWTKLGFEERNMTVLLSQRASQGINFTLMNVTHEHQGVYSCWDDGTLPNVSVHPRHYFIWVENASPSVIIDVIKPKRAQFFYDEEVTIGCQLPTDQSQWKIMWYEEFTGKITECRNPKQSATRFLSCTMYMGHSWFNKVFWCESSTGERSNVLNTTITVSKLVLEAPTRPVTEGDDMTLHCWEKDYRTQKLTPAHSGFHVNYRFIGSSTEGTITVKGMTKANEGFYQCSTYEDGMAHKTWITVKART